MERITDKIEKINEFIEQLAKIVPSSLEEYKSGLEKKAACERYAEKIIEAVVDLAFLIIKFKKFKIPQDDIDAFNVLAENNVIDNNLATKLKKAKGMRNIITHEYSSIDDEIVFDSVSGELEDDVKEFMKRIGELLKKSRKKD